MGKVRIPAVTLRRHPLHWKRVPGHLKLRILDGVERITEIHAGLAEALQVTSLPPVVVHDALWWEPGVTIIVSGRAGPIPIAPPRERLWRRTAGPRRPIRRRQWNPARAPP